MRFLFIFLTLTSLSYIDSYSQTAPVININRDDHVATVEIDFEGDNGIQLWNVGDDGLDPSGYHVQWWLDDSEMGNVIADCGCETDNTIGSKTVPTEANPMEIVTANSAIQIQPIANNALYHVKVQKLNSFGEYVGPSVATTFMGGDPTRVDSLRSAMTFFDDFNLPMGPADERKWNNAMTAQTDPRFNLFFVNHQCHTHSLSGTKNGAAGDKAQVAQRARKPIFIDSVDTRQIVFDMDGLFGPRSVWYLDFNPIKTDLSDHMSFFDADGDTGLPADIIRLRTQGNSLSVHLVDNQGSILNVAETDLSDHGVRLSTNVRRFFDVRLSTTNIEIFVDSVSVIDHSFTPGDFEAGVYDVLWHVVGYNTSKDDNPYFLSHWDNFGFDGPNIEPYVIHNYKTRIDSTDHQRSNESLGLAPVFEVIVPDDVRPLQAADTNQVWLVFTYMQANYNSFDLDEDDFLLFNGDTLSLPGGINNTVPLVPELTEPLGSIMSNRIHLEDAYFNGTSPLAIGANEFQFFCGNTGIMNLHVEVLCPEESILPPYTPPADIHPFPLHHHLPKLGTAAQIVDINGIQLTENNDSLYGPTIAGEVPVEFLAGNQNWASWGPHLLHRPARTAEMWSIGSTQGIANLKFYIKPVADTLGIGILVDSLHTSVDAPAPQVRYTYMFDSQEYANGKYHIYLEAESPQGIKSHPAYGGEGFIWDASEFSGAYRPIEITIGNSVPTSFIFNGTNDNMWLNGINWNTGYPPPYNYGGLIEVNADCIVSEGYLVRLGLGGEMKVAEDVTLELSED